MIYIAPDISIPESEIIEQFIRSSGPGGQNVNKVATAVQLRFDVKNSPSLSQHVRSRLMALAGKRLTENGLLIIEARRNRTQEQNRKDALEKFRALLQKASQKPKKRQKTKPTQASRQRRLDTKHHRSKIKRDRLPPVEDL